MPEVFYSSDKTTFILLLTQSEINEIIELALRKHVSINEVLEACFVIGSVKITDSPDDPKSPT